MDVEKWLEQVKYLNELINEKLAERDDIFTMSTRLNPNLDDMPHGTGSVSDPVGNAAIKLARLGHEIDDLTDQLVDLKKEIANALCKLPTLEHLILHKIYIKGMKIKQIAKDVNYSQRQVLRIKERALKNLQVVTQCHIEV